MGFLDNVSNAFDSSKATVERTGRTASLRSQLRTLAKQRQDCATALGAALYEASKEKPELREGFEDLFNAVGECDARRAEIEAEIAAIEQQAQTATRSSCPNCGISVRGDNAFCPGCGFNLAQHRQQQAEAAAAEAAAAAAQAPANGVPCPKCGYVCAQDSLFCISCGAKLEAPAPEAAPEAPAAPGICPVCGAAYREGAAFCMGCGTPAGAQHAAPATPAPAPAEAEAPSETPAAE